MDTHRSLGCSAVPLAQSLIFECHDDLKAQYGYLQCILPSMPNLERARQWLTRKFQPVEDTFAYLPLNEEKGELRLITFLEPPRGHEPVQCKLETVSLISLNSRYKEFSCTLEPANLSKRKLLSNWLQHNSQAPEKEPVSSDYHPPTEPLYRYTWGDYAALSYTWGLTSPETDRKIILNDKFVTVGKNLEIVLRALSVAQEFKNGFKLWVDALCINQVDDIERGCQVARMRDIYGDAYSVIAWLGEEENGSNEAIRLLYDLLDASKGNLGPEMEVKLQSEPQYLRTGWMALNQLMRREYWYRLWIIQEVVLGASGTIIRCGNMSIDWESFCHAIGFLYDYLWTIKDRLLKSEMISNGLTSKGMATTGLHLVHQDLWTLSHFEKEGTGRIGFGRLLDVAGSARSRDARDRVYGLLGMIDPSIESSLSLNYTTHPGEVFADIARLFIIHSGNLEAIREGNPWGGQKGPSWAADWTWNGRLRHSRLELPSGWTQFGPPHLQIAKPSLPYCASGESQMQVSYPANKLHLVCRGFVVDKIDGLTAREKGFATWERESIIQSKQRNSIYGSVAETAIALHRALLGDRQENGKDLNDALLHLPSSFGDTLPDFQRLGWNWFCQRKGYYYRYSVWRRKNKNFWLGEAQLGDYFTDKLPENAPEEDFKEAYSCFDRMCKGRRFMTTENGYMGWAPDNIYGTDENQTREGDLIAILFGCSTPVTIRPHGSKFQVLGGTYVQGLMEGEAMESLKSGLYHVQDFVFC